MERVIFLIDMDCFYVQIEQKYRPETVGLPCAVVQYTSLTAASLIAVSYEARNKGVTRFMNGEAAKKQYPDLVLFQVPSKRGKADLTKYREAGAEVIKSISRFTSKVERASIDEAYIDVTDLLNSNIDSDCSFSLENSNLVIDPDSLKSLYDGKDMAKFPFSLPIKDISGKVEAIEHLTDGQKLKQALNLAQKIKDQILADTNFRCSIGVAGNRILAKMACSLNKPNKITLVPMESVQHLMNYTKVKKVPGLGGKLGNDLIARFNLEFIGALTEIPLSTLVEEYGEKTGNWLYELCRGRDYQAVSVRTLVKSIACSKYFPGKSALKTDSDLLRWLTNLAGELVERIAIDRSNHNRIPTTLYFYTRVDTIDTKSRSLPSSILDSIPPRNQQTVNEEAELLIAQKIAEIALEAVKSIVGAAPVTSLCLSVGKFRPDHAASCGDVRKLLSDQAKPSKRESFFRRFIKQQEQNEPIPKKSCINQSAEPQRKVDGLNKAEQPQSSKIKGSSYFQHLEATADTILCEECGSRVLVHLMPEHSDFHFAKKVQQEWNRDTNQTSNTRIIPTNSRLNRRTNRGRGRGKNDAKHTRIDTFLIKKD